MLTPALSRLKGAPSTCVCCVGHRNEEAIMGASRHEMKPDTHEKLEDSNLGLHTHVNARSNSKSRQSQNVAASESEK